MIDLLQYIFQIFHSFRETTPQRVQPLPELIDLPHNQGAIALISRPCKTKKMPPKIHLGVVFNHKLRYDFTSV